MLRSSVWDAPARCWFTQMPRLVTSQAIAVFLTQPILQSGSNERGVSHLQPIAMRFGHPDPVTPSNRQTPLKWAWEAKRFAT